MKKLLLLFFAILLCNCNTNNPIEPVVQENVNGNTDSIPSDFKKYKHHYWVQDPNTGQKVDSFQLWLELNGNNSQQIYFYYERVCRERDSIVMALDSLVTEDDWFEVKHGLYELAYVYSQLEDKDPVAYMPSIDRQDYIHKIRRIAYFAEDYNDTITKSIVKYITSFQ